MILENSIIEEVKTYVANILENELSPNITYHSLKHTEEVVKSALEIANKQGVSHHDVMIIHIAAWFHDLGYSKGCENHEKLGADMAEIFLKKRGFSKYIIDQIKGCIMATQMPQNPQNSLEQILCDADLMHLARADYFKKSDLLYEEMLKARDMQISDGEWLKMNVDFLDKHCFFTAYAKKNYEPAVKENLKKVTERLKSWKKKTK